MTLQVETGSRPATYHDGLEELNRQRDLALEEVKNQHSAARIVLALAFEDIDPSAHGYLDTIRAFDPTAVKQVQDAQQPAQ